MIVNKHIFKNLITWNNLSPNKNFKDFFEEKKFIEKEIVELKKPVQHLTNFFNFSFMYFVGYISGEIFKFLFRIRSSFFIFLVFFCIILFFYFIKQFKINKINKLKIKNGEEILKNFNVFLENNLYNFDNYDLMDNDFKKYCHKTYNSQEYSSFKIAIINQNLTDKNILFFYKFLNEYCEENIDNISMKNFTSDPSKERHFKFFHT